MVAIALEAPVFDLPPDTTITFGDSLIIVGPKGYADYLWNGRSGKKDFFFKPEITGLFEISLTLEAASGCSKTERMLISVIDPQTLLHAGRTEEIEVYPNPAFDRLNVSGEFEPHGFRIYDVSGNDLSGNVSRINATSLNISHLTPGLYFFSFKELKPIRFIKQ